MRHSGYFEYCSRNSSSVRNQSISDDSIANLAPAKAHISAERLRFGSYCWRRPRAFRLGLLRLVLSARLPIIAYLQRQPFSRCLFKIPHSVVRPLVLWTLRHGPRWRPPVCRPGDLPSARSRSYLSAREIHEPDFEATHPTAHPLSFLVELSARRLPPHLEVLAQMYCGRHSGSARARRASGPKPNLSRESAGSLRAGQWFSPFFGLKPPIQRNQPLLNQLC